MKRIRSYTAKLTGNHGKYSHILNTLNILERVYEYVFELGKESWFNQKILYKDCRSKFPGLHSKLLQQFLKLYKPEGKRKLPKKPIKPILILDNQTFNLLYNENTKFSNLWIRFNRRNYPLLGKYIFSKIPDFSLIKECRIYKRNQKLYCKMTVVENIPDPVVANSNNSTGIDINTKFLVTSDNKFYSTKKLYHRKNEYKKNRMKSRDMKNYTKDFIHKLTNSIVLNLVSQGSEVLILEDLKNLRQSASKKKGTSKGKGLNYVINTLPFGMFSDILEYKCLDHGISVVKVAPQYTSKKCNSCGSLDTERPKQNAFVCNQCGYHLHADLNAARNIRCRYTTSNEPPVNLAPVSGQFSRKPPSSEVR